MMRTQIFRRRTLYGVAICGIGSVFGFRLLKARGYDLSTEGKGSWQFYVLSTLPLRKMSRLWGSLAHREIPVPTRAPLYRLWASIFDSDLDEISETLESFPCLADFFSRRISIDAERPFSNADMMSPVDGKVVSCGVIKDNLVGQLKGVTFPLKQFLGKDPDLKTSSGKLFYVILYLAPGNYHRIHSPFEWKITSRRHFAGDLYPVLPAIAKFVPNLFAVNERIVLSGVWRHGYCSVTPVGAFNVGSIQLSTLIDPAIQTNSSQDDRKVRVLKSSTSASPTSDGYNDWLQYSELRSRFVGVLQKPGDEIGAFRMGSSVVILFETSSDDQFFFRIKAGDRIRTGDEIGVVLH
uniref:phosphatidylserine decarboxylase n=1 Tax=Hirondellea gigas TaxID=1518452 RepID=A0A6A7G5U8_9CRUS